MGSEQSLFASPPPRPSTHPLLCDTPSFTAYEYYCYYYPSPKFGKQD